MKLYVSNLPYAYGDSELQKIFSDMGEVVSAKVITDRFSGRSKGFGFVEMSDEDAKKAIAELNGKEVDGRALVVNEARPPRKREHRSRDRRSDFHSSFNRNDY